MTIYVFCFYSASEFQKQYYIYLLNLSKFRDVGITILVLQIKKLRQTLDHFAPAFPVSSVSFVTCIFVRLTR